jgi:plastocyanin
MVRRLLIVFAVVSIASLTGVPGGQASGRVSRSAGPNILPVDGALYGAYVEPDFHNGLDRRTADAFFEGIVGRPMAIERVYYTWDQVWPNADDYWSRDQGRTLYLSWNGATGDGSEICDWRGIGNGLYDARIHEQAANAIAFAAPMIFSFNHEPTNAPPWHRSCGTGADYIAATRHIHDVFVADGVTNLLYAYTSTALSFDHGRGDEFYAGNDVIDIIAVDGYNWFNCSFHNGPWREFSEIFDSFYAYGLSKGTPMVIAEYGTGEDTADPNRKAQWFTNAIAQAKAWPEIKGLSYFDVGVGGSCDRYVDTSPQSLAAFQGLALDPYTNPPVPMTPVTVADFSFSPNSANPSMGAGVTWTFNGPSNHTVTDSSGMGLYDSGSQGAGATFKYFFLSAGNYKYICTIHPTQMKGWIRIKPTAIPPSGGVSTTFTVTWAADKAPAGFVFDIQIKRPGGNWTTWLSDQTNQNGSFVPDQGTGTYQFRGRYRNTVSSKATAYSPAVLIVVS